MVGLSRVRGGTFTRECGIHFTDVDEEGDHGHADGEFLVRKELFAHDARAFTAA